MKRFSLFFVALMFSSALFAQQDTLPAPSVYRVNGVSFKMVRVEKGDFWMGAQHLDTADFNYDRLSQSDELPVHNVKIKEDFYIGQTEVTQKLWKAVMGNNPSKKKCPKRPVENVSYYDIQEFLKILDSLTGMNFRLPTEAEFEYVLKAEAKDGDPRLDWSFVDKEGSLQHPWGIRGLMCDKMCLWDRYRQGGQDVIRRAERNMLWTDIVKINYENQPQEDPLGWNDDPNWGMLRWKKLGSAQSALHGTAFFLVVAPDPGLLNKFTWN